MALPEAAGDADSLSLSEAARLLGVDLANLLALLIRGRFLYRYTGVGRPLAYVRWVRAGLFVNAPSEVRITACGIDRIAGAVTAR